MICNTAFCAGRLRVASGIFLLALGIITCSIPAPAAADGLGTPAEYIVAFVRYVQWQDEDQLPAWNVCFVGEMPRDQERSYADRTVRNKPFAVRNIKANALLDDCQILDLTSANLETVTRVLARSRRMPILTVGSGSEFCSLGGQICLHIESDAKSPQKFEVNLSNIRESKLQVSARLLAIGVVRNPSEEAR